jgi:glucose/arabinose dehydrogenase
VPPDNPFVGRAGYKPEIYSMGHRNQLGLAVNPETGQIWASEQGPNGGDEINIIQAGKNYGWPVISYGRSYAGPKVSNNPWQDSMEQPWVVWVPSIALSGLTFYTGDKFPGWQRNVFVGGLRQGERPAHGADQPHRVQRQVGRDTSGAYAARAGAAHPRRTAGARWLSVRAERRRTTQRSSGSSRRTETTSHE